MDAVKKSTVSGFALSLAFVCMLLVLMMTLAKQPDSGAKLVLILAILVLAVCTILQWIKCVRLYVNYTVERNAKTGPGES
ncbi:MAG: hypothetical protein JSW59_05340 [Phycisphaerales bacterium]|nr:MAG: hypothetical protein JSW59_05340 [Phycisphaerales bacterium]